jgi:ABC-2 type transport system ATP-binding protein
MHAIAISGLCKTYKGKKGAFVAALKNLNLEVAQGEIFGFLGPNGAGKSTTIKTLLGLIAPDEGRASIMGVDISAHAARKRVGYLPENPAFYDYLSAEEYLLFVGKTFGIAEAQVRAKGEEVLRLLDLWEARKRPIRSYSKGMVQRLGLAQVLVHDPDVYILDEPMSGLDPVGRALVKEIMLDLKSRGKCVFFSTHITADVESVCDRVGIIVHGELQSMERVDTILAKGVLGFSLTIQDPATGTTYERSVARDELSRAMRELQDSGCEITLVEPKRKGLEEFFLEIVGEKGGR